MDIKNISLKVVLQIVAPTITAIAALVGSLYASFNFYQAAVDAHAETWKLVEKQAQAQKQLDATNQSIQQMTMQMTVMASALQFEKDAKEFAELRAKKSSLSAIEYVRYCELYRSLKVGDVCDI